MLTSVAGTERQPGTIITGNTSCATLCIGYGLFIEGNTGSEYQLVAIGVVEASGEAENVLPFLY